MILTLHRSSVQHSVLHSPQRRTRHAGHRGAAALPTCGWSTRSSFCLVFCCHALHLVVLHWQLLLWHSLAFRILHHQRGQAARQAVVLQPLCMQGCWQTAGASTCTPLSDSQHMQRKRCASARHSVKCIPRLASVPHLQWPPLEADGGDPPETGQQVPVRGSCCQVEA